MVGCPVSSHDSLHGENGAKANRTTRRTRRTRRTQSLSPLSHPCQCSLLLTSNPSLMEEKTTAPDECSLVGGQVEGGPGGNSAHASHCTVGCEREIGGRSSLECERGQSETTVHCVTEESCVLLQCSGLKTSRPTSTLLLNCTIKASAQANFHSALASQQKAVRGSLSSP